MGVGCSGQRNVSLTARVPRPPSHHLVPVTFDDLASSAEPPSSRHHPFKRRSVSTTASSSPASKSGRVRKSTDERSSVITSASPCSGRDGERSAAGLTDSENHYGGDVLPGDISRSTGATRPEIGDGVAPDAGCVNEPPTSTMGSFTSSQWSKGKCLLKTVQFSIYQGLSRETGQSVMIQEFCASVEVAVVGSDPAESMRTKVMREIETLSKFQHPNIIRLIDHEQSADGSHLFLVLEKVVGSVRRMIEEFGCFKECLARRYAYQTLKGLACLHSFGYVHRGICGASLYITEDGGIKIANFSPSLSLSDGPHVFKASTIYWASPEVLEGSEGIDGAADIYSFGATLIEMLTGNPPYYHLDLVSLRQVLGCETALPKFPRESSSELKSLLEACLDTNPKNRPSAAELLNHKWFAPFQTDQMTTEAAEELICPLTPPTPPALSTLSPASLSASRPGASFRRHHNPPAIEPSPMSPEVLLSDDMHGPSEDASQRAEAAFPSAASSSPHLRPTLARQSSGRKSRSTNTLLTGGAMVLSSKPLRFAIRKSPSHAPPSASASASASVSSTFLPPLSPQGPSLDLGAAVDPHSQSDAVQQPSAEPSVTFSSSPGPIPRRCSGPPTLGPSMPLSPSPPKHQTGHPQPRWLTHQIQQRKGSATTSASDRSILTASSNSIAGGEDEESSPAVVPLAPLNRFLPPIVLPPLEAVRSC